ncbi:hypothetical protein [Hymenobacter sp. YC55]|uniref:hypothetical protein n=1 Tax=Hymenobacter sp. YC55 TaxID=3034019 RepID=UPI0023F84419|nr:hypothetical protein [Hymenobacter sp. YC55]MDF7810774.1 hypothetical protein [Hymenobacter sp. YC55]
MKTPITLRQISILRKACEEATPAPWRVAPPNSRFGCILSAQPDITKNTLMLGHGLSEENANFAQAARAWMPRLLDEVEAILRAQLDPCPRPPFGWACCKGAGHEGPCAMRQTDECLDLPWLQPLQALPTCDGICGDSSS